MSESAQPENPGSQQSARTGAECFCQQVGEAFRKLGELFTPPEEAEKHFRQARIEMLKGVRGLIDHRIEVLSRSHVRGTKITVE
ncbi:MAG: hypothetical protein WBW33_37465 [Bryobacteraceae bacterium]